MAADLIRTRSFQLATYSQGDPQARKLALLLPGKLDSKDYAHMRSHVEHLAGLGYLAATFDPPGTWDSPGDISLYSMTNYLKAIDELIEHFRSKPTLLMGHSRGATMATIAGARNPQVFAFISVMSTFTKGGFQDQSAPDWQANGYAISKRDLPPGGGPKLKEYSVPYSFFEDQQTYDLTAELTSTPKPKLFIYGTDDALATPAMVKQTYGAFAEPKQLYELNSDHDYRFNPTLIGEVNQAVSQFLTTLPL